MSGPRFDAEEFARLAEKLHEAGATLQTAREVVDYAREVTSADEAGLTMIRPRKRLETVAPTSPVVNELDRLQYDLQEGPCYDATWEQHTLVSEDLATDERWPRWAPRVASLGIASVLAVEMGSDGERIGAINLFSRTRRRFSQDDIAFAHLFARHAAVALSSSERIAGLTTALDARKIIGQAEGILMERYKVDEAHAFDVLKRYSQDNNIKLRVVAEEIVAARGLPADVSV